MKRYSILLLTLLFALTVHAQVTKNQADSIVLRQVLDSSLYNKVDVYRFSQPLTVSNSIQLGDGSSIDASFQSSWGYFIDLIPFANWSHPCQVCFVNTADGCYTTTDCDLPPYHWSLMDTVQMMSRPAPVPRPQCTVTGQRLTSPETDPHLWAVLLCAATGDFDSYYPARRFWGDLSCVYTTLTDIYGFQENTLSQPSNYGQTNTHILVLAPTTICQFDSDLNHSSYLNRENDFLYRCSNEMPYHTILESQYYYSENELGRLFNKLADILTPEDKLFVYVTGDGSTLGGYDESFFPMYWKNNQNYTQPDKVFPDEFSDMISNINCSQIMLMMQSNFSEGFVDSFMDTEDAMCKNRAVFTVSSSFSYSEKYITPQIGISDDKVVNEFTYYWASANLGYYPCISFDPIDENSAVQGPWDYPGFGLVGSSDPTSGMPWQTFFQNDPYGHNAYDIDPDTDGDNILSLKESFTFADNLDTWSTNGYYYPYNNISDYPETPSASYESSFTAEAATITGYKGVVDGVVATGADNNRYLLDGDICISRNSALQIKDSTSFVSDGKTITNMGALYTENGLRKAFFKNTRIWQEGTSMTLDSCVFDSCYLVSALLGTNSITNSQFLGTDFKGGQNATRDGLVNGLEITLSNNTFTDSPDKSITMIRVPSFEITGNSVVGGTTGIRLNNCNGLQADGVIEENSIQGCDGSGIEAYSSNALVRNNCVCSNGFGIKLFNNSNLAIIGNQYASNYSQTQRIQNNTKYQIYATKRSFPSQIHYNCIKGVNTNDTLIYFDNAGQLQSGNDLDVEYNCWKPLNNNNAISAVLYAVNGQSFDFTPTWNPPGGGRGVDAPSAAQRMLCSADSLSQLGCFGAALDTLRALVDYAPTSEESKVALKNMFAIAEKTGKGFDSLRDYYRNTLAVTCQPDLQDIGDNLANKCDEALGNYQAAIAWYENKLVDSATSFADSVFAVIDLGDLYLLLDSIGERSIVGSMSQYRPKAANSHAKHSDWLVSLLPSIIENTDSRFETVAFAHSAAFPNPTTGLVMVEFELLEEGLVEIAVVDNLGRNVETKPLGRMVQGKHDAEFNFVSLPQGFYVCTIFLNGHPIDTIKIVKIS